MTVQTNLAIAPYIGNGVAVSFPVPFRFLDNTHLLLTLVPPGDDAIPVILVLNTDYTVFGARDLSGGTAILNVAPPLNHILVIQRNVPFTQLIDYRANDPFPEEAAENMGDQLTMALQQLKELLSRALTLPPQLSGQSGALPAPDPLKPLVWNAAGTGLENGDTLGTGDMLLRSDLASPAAGKGGELVAFLQSGAGALPRNVTEKLRDTLCVLDYVPQAERAAILAGTSTYDATAGVQAAVNAAVADGRSLYAPGRYRLTAPILIAGRMRLYGDGVEPNIGDITSETRGEGSWFYLDHFGIGFDLNSFTVGGTRTGIEIEGIGTYRNQPAPDVLPFTPNAHDCDFRIFQVDATFNDVMLLNPTNGIRVQHGGYGRITCNRVRGQPLTTGIDVEHAADQCRFNDIHFWPFWSNDVGARGWMQSDGAAFRLARCDNPTIDGAFALGYNKFIEIRGIVDGTTSKLRVSNCDGDVGGWFLHILAGANGATAHFSNCVAQGATTFASGTNHNVQIQADNCRVQFTNCEFKDPNGSNILVSGTGNTIIAGGGLMLSLWNRANAGHLGISIGANNQFRADAQPFIIAAGVGGTKFIGGAGTIDCPLGFYTTSVTTAANGRANMTHNSGATPRKFIGTVASTTGRYVTLVSFQATNVTIEVRDAAGIVASTPNIPVYWQIGY